MPGLSGRILVVDDNKVIRQLIRVNLELEGFEVVTAADGAECLDVVHHVRPDVVTLDVVMPRLNGLHTAARLRSDPRTRDIPIAIVSACTDEDRADGEVVGVDAFLAKPFEPTDLVRTVGLLAREGRRQEREREAVPGLLREPAVPSQQASQAPSHHPPQPSPVESEPGREQCAGVEGSGCVGGDEGDAGACGRPAGGR